MKKTPILIAVLIVIALGLVLWFSNQGVDTEGKVHTDIYADANGTQLMNLTTSGFRPQEINGEEIGWSSYLHVEWEAPEKEYNHFLLTITNPETGWTETQSGEHDRFSLDIGELEPATDYVLVLQACLQPRCEEWYVIEEEVTATTPHRYWRLDGDDDVLYGLQADAYTPGTEDELQQAVFTEADLVIAPDVADFDEELNPSLLLEDAQIYWVEGRSYEQRALIPLKSAPASTTGIVSATLLNP